jgi:fatty acid desaturase
MWKTFPNHRRYLTLSEREAAIVLRMSVFLTWWNHFTRMIIRRRQRLSRMHQVAFLPSGSCPCLGAMIFQRWCYDGVQFGISSRNLTRILDNILINFPIGFSSWINPWTFRTLWIIKTLSATSMWSMVHLTVHLQYFRRQKLNIFGQTQFGYFFVEWTQTSSWRLLPRRWSTLLTNHLSL